MKSPAYIIQPKEIDAASQVGGKAAALAALRDTDLAIPAWFVLSTAAFYDSLSKPERMALAAAGDRASLLSILAALEPSPSVRAQLQQALTALCPHNEPVAVRSSALDEDGADHSFAGQLDSFLGVPPSQVAEKVVAVWCSAFSERILAYRRERGLALTPQPPAVLVQCMVQPDSSGVAFSADPVTGQREVAVIGAIFGLGAALVSGAVDADTYRVDKHGRILTRTLVEKQTGYDGQNGRSAAPVGTWQKMAGPAHSSATRPASSLRTMTLPDEPLAQPALGDTQILAVAELARRVEQLFGCPQDIEWAIAAEQLYLLQARPITTLTNRPDPGDGLNLWDDSNIAESYPGVTTPLTFSFARRAYEAVYRQFCALMNVPAETIAKHDTTFQRMLGLMRGRIYYNLLSWYQVLAMLPGYRFNRRFMEQMMGVKESLPTALQPEQASITSRARLQDGLRLLGTVLGLIVNYLTLSRRISAFNRRLRRALGHDRPDLSNLGADELVSYYRSLEQQQLTRWDAPLVNDFFAMIFYGLLRKLSEKWGNDINGTLQNELLSGTGGIISTEPVTKMRHMAQLVAEDPAFVAILVASPLAEIRAHLPQQPEFEAQYRAYLDQFGDRCLEELKLESPTLHDDPLILLRSVGQLARGLGANPGPEGVPVATSSQPPDLVGRPQPAERRVQEALARRPLRYVIFNWVLWNTRRLIRNRENLRFERTRLFGRARMIFVELGHRFYAHDRLDDPRDIFYLEVDETLGFVDGTSTTTDLKGLVKLRRAEFERYRATASPPSRFETHGIPYVDFGLAGSHAGLEGVSANSSRDITRSNRQTLTGLGCSPGLVRGQVRVVTDPKQAQLQPGEILVAERTDPGWIMLFPAARGLLVEHGSLLSHSAIVSREMGLPAVVALEGVTRWLTDGDWVEFDGSTGEVRKVESVERCQAK